MSEHASNTPPVNKIVPLDRIKPHPENYNTHPDEQLSQLGASYTELGQFRSIVLWEQSDGSYIQLAGHGVLEAMRRNDAKEVRADVLPPSLDPLAAKRIMLADNLHAQNSVPDDALLAQLLQEQQDAGFDLASLGTDDETLRQMLEALGDEFVGSGEQERDEAEDELPEEVETRAKVGDIWQLGRHRIACIDSCDAEQVKKLVGTEKIAMVWADPPYGVNMVGKQRWMGDSRPFGGVKNRGKKPDIKVGTYPAIIGDESTETATQTFHLYSSLYSTALQIWWGANNYVHVLPSSTCWLVWDKENTGDFADAELAWCSDKSPVRIFKHMWNGMLKDSEHGQKRVHPSQKPIALAEWAFEKYGNDGDMIFDPFLGSGMSVIAAENLHRTVYGCELSPEYIDVIIARWEKHTGEQATLLERVEEVAHA